MLTQEQTKQIKEQIIRQIESWQVPEQQKEAAKQQIQAMNPKQLEQFLIQNKLIKTPGQAEPGQIQEEQAGQAETEQKGEVGQTGKPAEQCPFCLIVQGKIPAYKLWENPDSVAVLEINPLSKGHTLIIPKTHIAQEDLSMQTFDLAKYTAKKIKEKLKPKEVNISTSNFLGHGIINVVPIYGDEKGERKKASEAELKKTQKELIETEKKIEEKLKKQKKKAEKLEKAPVRMP